MSVLRLQMVVSKICIKTTIKYQHFITFIRICRIMIQPYRISIPKIPRNVRQDPICFRQTIYLCSAFPIKPIFAFSICSPVKPAGMIPHLKFSLLRIIKYPTIKRTSTCTKSIVHFQLCLRFQ